MATPQIFPFKLNGRTAERIFHTWRQENRDMLNREHGSIGFVGTSHATPEICAREGTIYISPGHRKSWSYYQFDIFAVSESEIEIKTYGMADLCYGGRGELQDTFEVSVDREVLAAEVKRERMEYSAAEYRERLAKAEAEAFRREVEKVYAELFPDAA
jgi:hypothetical protein